MLFRKKKYNALDELPLIEAGAINQYQRLSVSKIVLGLNQD